MGKSRLLREFEHALSASTRRPRRSAPAAASPTARGIVFWALGEVLRAECGIVDSDSSDEAWGKLSRYVADLFGDEQPPSEPGEREAALIGRLLGIEVPPELVPDGATTRSACARRSSPRCASGSRRSRRRRPLVIAFEDIHWADDGMLDAIEHLAQWVRAPLMLVCLARDELLDRRPGWGGGRRSATQLMLDPLSAERHAASSWPRCCPAGAEVRAAGGGALRRQPAVRRGDGAPDRRGGQRSEAAELPDTVQAVLAARLDALEPFERRLVQQAAVVGRTFWEGSLAPLAEAEGTRPRPRAHRRSRRRTSSRPAPRAGWRASASWPSSTC